MAFDLTIIGSVAKFKSVYPLNLSYFIVGVKAS